MKQDKQKLLIKNKLVPYVAFPAVIGVFTGIVIFLFKVASLAVMRASKALYAFVKEEPAYIPLLLLGAAGVGVLAASILRLAKECRGGGIPTAIASIRGLVPIKWVQGLFVLFFTSLMTYFVGVPLGNEGPSVQMGAAIGKGASKAAGKRSRAVERYGMTGGACAGFAIATGAPLSGIVFALEEAHRRFSPTLLAVASVSVLTGTVTNEILSKLFSVDTVFFDLTVTQKLPFRFLWVAALVGILCGGLAMIFTHVYHFMKGLEEKILLKIPFVLKIACIFLLSAAVGLVSIDFIGTGHDLIEKILHGDAVWYMLVLALLIRMLLMIIANVQGVSGGLFVPTLTFGAVIAALCAKALVALEIVGGQYFSIIVLIGTVSFFAASSRTPLTAMTFAAEALCLSENLLPVIAGVVLAYLTVELFEKSSFTDAVIESKTERAHEGKSPTVVDSHMTVEKDAFAIGLNVRDILWPPTCVVLSIDKKILKRDEDKSVIREGDVLHLHYLTYDEQDTMDILTHILGRQPEDEKAKIHVVGKEHVTPLE